MLLQQLPLKGIFHFLALQWVPVDGTAHLFISKYKENIALLIKNRQKYTIEMFKGTCLTCLFTCLSIHPLCVCLSAIG
jgi:hypothetical protein